MLQAVHFQHIKTFPNPVCYRSYCFVLGCQLLFQQHLSVSAGGLGVLEILFCFCWVAQKEKSLPVAVCGAEMSFPGA